MSVEGSPRDLHPIVRDDIHRIACEILRNAFRHAQAARIEAEITYGERELRLRIRDDGKGIDSSAQLNLWSEAGAGTEVELRVPGAVAYTASGVRDGVFRILRKHRGGS